MKTREATAIAVASVGHALKHKIGSGQLIGKINKIEIQLSSRQVELRNFADDQEFNFYPQKVRNALKYKDFPVQNGSKIQYEENILTKYISFGKVEVSDITLSEWARKEQSDSQITLVQISELDAIIPDFVLEPESLWSRFSELVDGKDTVFKSYPGFSSKYLLRGNKEEAMREFFNESLIQFLESHQEMHIESHKNKLLIYKKRELLNITELSTTISFVDELMVTIAEKTSHHA